MGQTHGGQKLAEIEEAYYGQWLGNWCYQNNKTQVKKHEKKEDQIKWKKNIIIDVVSQIPKL